MIRQDIYLQRYDWHVRVYYAATTYWVERIVRDLRLIGCSGADLEEARRNLSAGRLDTGLTYSNYRRRATVIVIALASSPAEFFNSLEHEKGHLCRHVSLAFHLDPYGEEAQYLSGEVGQRMFPVARRFLCEHCREELSWETR